MATVLLTWELGEAMGHVGILRPVTDSLLKRGHRVVAAIRDMTKASVLSPDGRISCLQAPVRLGPVANPYRVPSTFAHILHNVGFGAVEELRPMVDGWRATYELVQPDLILAEHSPTAMLAAYSGDWKCATIGTGFTCPPDCMPLPDWRPYLRNDAARLRREELRVRDVMNELLVEYGGRPFDRVTDLYSRSQATVLTTFPELDHFGPRADAHYWGTWSEGHGQSIDWPSGRGPKIFAYLKPFAALNNLLDHLVCRRLPTVIYGPTIDRQTQDRYRCPTLRFAERPVELGLAGRQCDIAILNATHGTTASMLLAGKPLLLIPLYLEQQISADNVARMGAGLSADPNRALHIVDQLDGLLGSDGFRNAAGRFAQRYSDDRRRRMEELTGQIDDVLRN
jgi:hypothetical protein